MFRLICWRPRIISLSSSSRVFFFMKTLMIQFSVWFFRVGDVQSSSCRIIIIIIAIRLKPIRSSNDPISVMDFAMLKKAKKRKIFEDSNHCHYRPISKEKTIINNDFLESFHLSLWTSGIGFNMVRLKRNVSFTKNSTINVSHLSLFFDSVFDSFPGYSSIAWYHRANHCLMQHTHRHT